MQILYSRFYLYTRKCYANLYGCVSSYVFQLLSAPKSAKHECATIKRTIEKVATSRLWKGNYQGRKRLGNKMRMKPFNLLWQFRCSHKHTHTYMAFIRSKFLVRKEKNISGIHICKYKLLVWEFSIAKNCKFWRNGSGEKLLSFLYTYFITL